LEILSTNINDIRPRKGKKINDVLNNKSSKDFFSFDLLENNFFIGILFFPFNDITINIMDINSNGFIVFLRREETEHYTGHYLRDIHIEIYKQVDNVSTLVLEMGSNNVVLFKEFLIEYNFSDKKIKFYYYGETKSLILDSFSPVGIDILGSVNTNIREISFYDVYKPELIVSNDINNWRKNLKDRFELGTSYNKFQDAYYAYLRGYHKIFKSEDDWNELGLYIEAPLQEDFK
jgi:hypothetical protein